MVGIPDLGGAAPPEGGRTRGTRPAEIAGLQSGLFAAIGRPEKQAMKAPMP
jgi:hypothetical protein